MLDKIHFADNKSRKFVLYKGWLTEDNESYLPSIATQKIKEDAIETFYTTKPHEHLTYNIKNRNGKLVLQKNVRKITWNENGYFIIYDDNEDELIGKYKSSFPSNEFHYEYKLADEFGKLISEMGFQSIRPYYNKLFRVEYENKFNIIDFNGNFLLKEPVDYVFGVSNESIYFVNDGILYRLLYNSIEAIKNLKRFDNFGRYYCGNGVIIENGKMPNGSSMSEYDIFSYGTRLIGRESKNNEIDGVNILIKGEFLLFDIWYDDIIKNQYGLFEVKTGLETNIIDATGKEIIKKAILIKSDESHIIYQKEEKFYITDYFGNNLHKEFSSCIWTDGSRSWNINISNGKIQHLYLHGQAPEILDYAQSLLRNKNLLAILEHDKIWYMIDKLGNLTECFRNYSWSI